MVCHLLIFPQFKFGFLGTHVWVIKSYQNYTYPYYWVESPYISMIAGPYPNDCWEMSACGYSMPFLDKTPYLHGQCWLDGEKPRHFSNVPLVWIRNRFYITTISCPIVSYYISILVGRWKLPPNKDIANITVVNDSWLQNMFFTP